MSDATRWRRPAVMLAALVALQLPWLDRPVHYDEANFLVLARGAAEDAWRPHDVSINWQGTTERAFDVLSNPPGIAWWLAPVIDAPVTVQRAWMLPWLAVAMAGALRLGRRFAGEAEQGALVLLTAPIAVLATPSLLPDAPLYALALLGVGGFIDAADRSTRAWPWALVAGSAALFRYSGLALFPLLVLYGARRRATLPALAAAVPATLLAIHDVQAYGAVHFLAMGHFQAVATTPFDLYHKAASALAMLGGAGALPIGGWGPGAVLGAAVGLGMGWRWGWPGLCFAALGGAGLGGAPARSRDRLFLAAWAFGGFAFLLTLRFTAARYWLPFLPGVLLALPTRWPRLQVATQLTLAMLLAADEERSARADRDLAVATARLGTGVFTGHWGWQWALEQAGWRALDEGGRVEPGTLVAIPTEAWPQPVEVACDRVVWEAAAQASLPWLPRGYTREGLANLHANWIAGDPPLRTIAPWTFANDPYERVKVCRP